MAVIISADERDAHYDQIIDKLSGIGDVWVAAEREDFPLADQLAREYRDELLLVDDLGWGPRPNRESVHLGAAPDVLHRIFERFQGSVVTERADLEARRIEDQQLEDRNQLVGEACDRVLRELRTRE